ncbi:inositol-phosphate phosphatase [Candidatus Saccharibacteria bacterium CG_4_10_14_0_2_um_filter_52_9]|nr:MAG: inositol-phosphate phosphatase [Candidatus Saccharibacteria bacterium CG_4_10_14_0_2_um_filter_52_9]
MRSPYLPVAINAVKAAQDVILKYYKDEQLEVATKEDQTPVTVADQQAEDIIKQTILAAFPDHTFFGEEGEKVDLQNHKGFTWIIDPIDGTKSFIRGLPLFGTLLALMHDGELIVGVSNAPVWGELVYAVKGEGAFLNDTQLSVSKVNQINEAYLSNGRLKYFEDIKKVPQLLAISREAKWARGLGDFWIYHLVAEGKVDIMMEGSVKFWDIAAAKVIVEEAGGTMSQLDGQPITYQSTTALATNGMLHDQIVAAMK